MSSKGRGAKKPLPASSSGGLAPSSRDADRTVTKIGAQNKAKSRKIQSDLEAKNALSKLKSWQVKGADSRVPGGRKGEWGNVWPSPYEGPTTFEDQVRALKMKHINDNGATPFGIAQSSDKDWEWAAKKLQMRRALEYDKLFVKMWDMTSPLEVAEARRIYPEFFENRKKIIRLIAEMQMQLANIHLTGYKDKSDVDFLIELRMLNTPKDAMGIPEFLNYPVHQLNSDAAIQAMADISDSLGSVDVSQMLAKTDTELHAAPHRTGFGFFIDNRNTSTGQSFKDFFALGVPWAAGQHVEGAGQGGTKAWKLATVGGQNVLQIN